MSARVLVTDGCERSALALVRSLGRAGHQPWVVHDESPAIAAASRHARGSALIPGPAADPEAFVTRLAELGREWDIDVLIPTTDAAMSAVLPARARLAHMRIPAPDAETFGRVADRRCLLAVAEELGIPVPEQRVIRSPDDLTGAAADALPFPLAIKPAGSAPPIGEEKAPRVAYCRSADELPAVCQRFPEASYPLLAQRLIDGPGLGLFLLVWDGRTVASFAHRRVREKPPTGGASVFRESVAMDPQLLGWSEALLGRFGWRGVAMVEFKYDMATATPYLMEVNGRFWGSLQLAIDAGVDFPAILVDLAMGGTPRPAPAYRPGVKTRWFWGEVDHLAALVSPASAGTNGHGRLRPVASALRGWTTPAHLEVLKFRDLAPFLVETTQWLKAVTRR